MLKNNHNFCSFHTIGALKENDFLTIKEKKCRLRKPVISVIACTGKTNNEQNKIHSLNNITVY